MSIPITQSPRAAQHALLCDRMHAVKIALDALDNALENDTDMVLVWDAPELRELRAMIDGAHIEDARLRHARRILRDHDINDWDGSDDAERIAAARFAVVVEQTDNGCSWVLAAEHPNNIAGIIASLNCDGNVNVEYVSQVYDVATGEAVEFSSSTTVRVQLGSGKSARRGVSHS